MIKLEELCKCATQHLTKSQPDWERFADEFGSIFGCKMALFITSKNDDVVFLQSEKCIISTTSWDLVSAQFAKNISTFIGIMHDPVSPFIPSLRTDKLADSEYLNLDIVQRYMMPHRAFYLMMAFAALQDGSRLAMAVWRSDEEKDFCDIEKRRISIFMRFLATFFAPKNYAPINSVNEDLKLFGSRYSLTNSEVEIVLSLLQGHTLTQIAQDTDRAYRTVRWHMQNILEKCQVKSQKNLMSEFYRLIKR